MFLPVEFVFATVGMTILFVPLEIVVYIRVNQCICVQFFFLIFACLLDFC